MTNSGVVGQLTHQWLHLRYTKNDKINISRGRRDHCSSRQLVNDLLSFATVRTKAEVRRYRPEYPELRPCRAEPSSKLIRRGAIMVVNLLGNPNDFDVINNIIDGREIVMIEDNCESMGATFNGRARQVHSVSPEAFLAFFPITSPRWRAEFCVTDDEELYHVMLSIRAHGWTTKPTKNLIT